MAEVAKKLNRHLDNILTYHNHRITNAVVVGLNSKIQQVKSAVRGFRNFENFRIAILYLLRETGYASTEIHVAPFLKD